MWGRNLIWPNEIYVKNRRKVLNLQSSRRSLSSPAIFPPSNIGSWSYFIGIYRFYFANRGILVILFCQHLVKVSTLTPPNLNERPLKFTNLKGKVIFQPPLVFILAMLNLRRGNSKSCFDTLPPIIMVQWKMGPSNISRLSFRGRCSTEPWLWEKGHCRIIPNAH